VLRVKQKKLKAVGGLLLLVLGTFSHHTHTHPFNGPFSGTTQVSRYQKGTTNLDFTEARDSAWQWHQLGHMQVCTSLQTDNHASIPPLGFLQAGCPSCRPANSVKALEKPFYHTSKINNDRQLCRQQVTVFTILMTIESDI